MEKEGRLTLDLLTLIDTDAHVTQRTLAREMGVALGLANSYLKRGIHKGYVKVSQAPTNRYAYYLTPNGLAEKSALVGRYLSYSLRFYRDARGQCAAILTRCRDEGWARIVIGGTGDLAEIATLTAREFAFDSVVQLDVGPRRDAADLAADLAGLGRIDAILLADLDHPQAAFDRLARGMARERILPLPILGVTRTAPADPAKPE